MRSLVWFRVDLRTTDNTALTRACSAADKGVIALYILSPGDWKRHDDASLKVDFTLRTLRELSSELEKRNIPLLIETAESPGRVAKVVARIARDNKCDALHYNSQYEVDERRRDMAVVKELARTKNEVKAHHDQCAIAPGEVLTQGGDMYKVFTPFKRACMRWIDERGVPKPSGKPKKQPRLDIRPSAIPDRLPGFASCVPPDLWPAGEREALRRLRSFIKNGIDKYHDERDLPAITGTSQLSPHLAIGAISVRQCLAAAIEANHGLLENKRHKGPSTWISELFWRDFYKHILAAFCRVSMNQAFKPETDAIRWRQSDADYQCWCEGRTGYPIVDAAMRQLKATGWMHNRLRMITAMFFSKDLMLDWRLGERHFMRHLIDGDLGANNGGWQWSASTGTDAAPYFRIFNPTTQSKRFDPDGAFIREYVPELESLSPSDIHDPSPLARSSCGYPEPIVDHAEARRRAIAAFQSL